MTQKLEHLPLKNRTFLFLSPKFFVIQRARGRKDFVCLFFGLGFFLFLFFLFFWGGGEGGALGWGRDIQQPLGEKKKWLAVSFELDSSQRMKVPK